jgi:hypothetical protein
LQISPGKLVEVPMPIGMSRIGGTGAGEGFQRRKNVEK